jgi:hypothetical protein
MSSAILADRQLRDLLNQVEAAADELTFALDDQSIPEEVRDGILDGLTALDNAAQYLLRQRERNHASEGVRL